VSLDGKILCQKKKRRKKVPGENFPPGLQNLLEEWLDRDWTAGIQNANQLLAYTLQFIPVVKAINAALY